MNNRDSEINKEFYENYWGGKNDYKLYSLGNIWFDTRIRSLLKRIRTARIRTVIDVGCGDGAKTYLLSRELPYAKVKGIDFTEAGIAYAVGHYALPNLTFEAGDAKDIREDADMITCFECLEHIKDWEDVIQNFVRCRPRYIMISAPTGRMREYEKAFGHVRNFKKGQIEAYMSANGYRTLIASYGGFPLYSPILRDLRQIVGNGYFEVERRKMSKMEKAIHRIGGWMLCHLCFQNRKGDAFIGVFKRNA